MILLSAKIWHTVKADGWMYGYSWREMSYSQTFQVTSKKAYNGYIQVNDYLLLAIQERLHPT